jgi:hypothetical protein
MKQLVTKPTANTPTAIDKTTNTVRVLLLNISASTFRHRGCMDEIPSSLIKRSNKHYNRERYGFKDILLQKYPKF